MPFLSAEEAGLGGGLGKAERRRRVGAEIRPASGPGLGSTAALPGLSSGWTDEMTALRCVLGAGEYKPGLLHVTLGFPYFLVDKSGFTWRLCNGKSRALSPEPKAGGQKQDWE